MVKLLPNDRRATYNTFVFRALLLLSVLSVISFLMQFSFLSPEVYNSSKVIFGLLQIIFGLSSMILFIMWYSRAYWNLHQLGSPLEYSYGWSIGTWFVPILNLFRPRRIMIEIYTETQIQAGVTDVDLSDKLINWWWACFIISQTAANASFRFSRLDPALSDILSFISDVVDIAGLLLILKIIKDVSLNENEMFKKHSNA